MDGSGFAKRFQKSKIEGSNTKEKHMKFSDYTYVRPDYEAIKAQFSDLTDQLAQASDLKQLVHLWQPLPNYSTWSIPSTTSG